MIRSGAFIYLFLVAFIAVGQSPFPLIENKGQWPEQVDFSAEIGNGRLYIEEDGFTFDLYNAEVFEEFVSFHHSSKVSGKVPSTLPCHSYKVHFQNTSANRSWNGENPMRTTYSYFKGNEKSQWGTGAKSFNGIRMNDLYPGIDVKMYSNETFLKYDLVLKAGADPRDISFKYEGVEKIRISQNRLIVKTSVGTIIEQKPLAYQIINGKKQLVKCNYALEDNILSFEFPEGYSEEHELVIDPELIFSTYTGSHSDNFGYTATFDSEGFLYSGSSAFGNEYPTTTGAYDVSFNGGIVDIALSKFDTTGTFLVWSAYLGGSDDELPHSLIVNSANELFVYGTSSSTDYPTTDDAYDNSFNGGEPLNFLAGLGVAYSNGSDMVVSRLSAAGDELLASTFIGGNGNDGINAGTPLKFNYADEIRGEILIDDQDNIYIASTTDSEDFPVSSSAVQPEYGGGPQDGCLVKMDNSLTTIFWSSYLGGSEADAVYSIGLSSAGNAVVAGGSRSTDFPTTFGVLQPDFNGGDADGFITNISQAGDEIIYSSYYGSDAYDQVYFVELDKEDRVHVFGQTEKTGSHFIENADYGEPSSGQFITKFQPNISDIIWSTAFGTGNGTPNISPTAFLVDVCNKIYLSGWGSAIQGQLSVSGMDVTNDAFQSSTDGNDFYLMVLEDDASNLFYASYYGGNQSLEHVDGGTSRFNRKGVIYQAVCAGCGGNSDFPIEPNPGAVSSVNNNTCNLGVFKFDFDIPSTVADFSAPSAVCLPADIEFNNTSTNSDSFTWNFGDGNSSEEANPIHTYTESGTYDVQLIAASNSSCNLSDTVYQQVIVLSNGTSEIAEASICPGGQEQIGISPSGSSDISYEWIPDDYLSDNDVANPIAAPPVTSEYILLVSYGACTDTLFQTLEVVMIDLEVSGDTMLCGDDGSATLSANTSLSNVSYTWSASEDFSNPLNDDPEDPDAEVTISSPSTFYVQAEKSGCTVKDSVFVDLTDEHDEVENDLTTCPSYEVHLNVVNPSEEINYFWEPEELILAGQHSPIATIAVEETTTFYLHSEYGEDCAAVDSITVTVSDLDSASVHATAEPTTIPEGGSAQLNALPDGYNYQWIPPFGLNDANIQNPIATPDETTTYYVNVFDGECSAMDSIQLKVLDYVCGPPSIFVPNAFTPNGDQNNDVLYVRGENLTDMEFAIFNRWGEKVFETDDPSEGWDGSYEGLQVEPAVFAYYLEATCEGGLVYREEGNVTVIR